MLRRLMDETGIVVGDALFQDGEVDLGVRAGEERELAAPGEEFGRPAFVALDVRFLVTERCAVGRAEDGEGEGVCRRA